MAFSRLIPARAGNTTGLLPFLLPEQAHPRSRGEHTQEPIFSSRLNGSSPLARGTPEESLLDRGVLRLIPARAGNTSALKKFQNPTTAHPRSRGEHTRVLRSEGDYVGSSPLARGTRAGEGVWGACQRLIPARAGNTKYILGIYYRGAAHPRSRGEHTTNHLFNTVTCWLIPARAGNTNCFGS